MRKILTLFVLLCTLFSASGCDGISESKELKRIKSVAHSYSYTSEDSKLLKEKKNDKEVQKWLEDEAKKIEQKKYSFVQVSAFVSYLGSADVQDSEVDKQVRAFYADVMKEEKEQAFSSADVMDIFEYAEEIEKMREKVPKEDIILYLPYDEFSEYIQEKFTLTISENGVGGYYDMVADEYKNNYYLEKNQTSKYYYYDFFGDFMTRGFEKKVYRPTGEKWEEDMLKDYDYDSQTFYYKDTEIKMSSESFAMLPESKVYVCPYEDTYVVFIIGKDRIVGTGENVKFDLNYKA